MTPYQTLRHRMGVLEAKFLYAYGTRPGFKLRRYLRISGVHRGSMREHLGWHEWDGTKRGLIKLLGELGERYTFHDDLNYHLEIARGDVVRDAEHSADVTLLVNEINTGH